MVVTHSVVNKSVERFFTHLPVYSLCIQDCHPPNELFFRRLDPDLSTATYILHSAEQIFPLTHPPTKNLSYKEASNQIRGRQITMVRHPHCDEDIQHLYCTVHRISAPPNVRSELAGSTTGTVSTPPDCAVDYVGADEGERFVSWILCVEWVAMPCRTSVVVCETGGAW